MREQRGSKTMFGILAMILPMAGGLTALESRRPSFRQRSKTPNVSASTRSPITPR